MQNVRNEIERIGLNSRCKASGFVEILAPDYENERRRLFVLLHQQQAEALEKTVNAPWSRVEGVGYIPLAVDPPPAM